VDLTLEAGTTTALVGASGSGKSTLARCLAMLDGADGGEIRFRGTDVLRASRAELRKLRPQIQLVFQESAASLNTNFSVAEAIEEPLLIRGMALSERRARVAALMGEVGLAAGSAEKPVLEFSGGERQRIAIARALATEPAVMIFDESTSGLDDETEAQILELLARIQAERGLTYLVISHDLRTVAQIAGSVAVMHRGQIVEHAATGKVLSQPQHPYSQSLVAAHRQSEELARAAGQ
jgi:ABC-type glutathione transport system ATPase component